MGDFGKELLSSESKNRFGISNLFSNFTRCIERIGGGDDSAEGHDGETDNREIDGVGREEKDDVTFTDTHVGE